jgi:hypothetical protein
VRSTSQRQRRCGHVLSGRTGLGVIKQVQWTSGHGDGCSDSTPHSPGRWGRCSLGDRAVAMAFLKFCQRPEGGAGRAQQRGCV